MLQKNQINVMRKKKKKKINIVYLIAMVIMILLYFTLKQIVKITANPTPKKLTIKTQVNTPQISVTDAIWKAAQILKVPSKLYKSYNGDDAIFYSFGINKKLMELNYANEITTALVEKSGCKLISGVESSDRNQHKLKFYNPKEKQNYVIRIYYGKSEFFTKQKKQLAIIVDDFGGLSSELLTDFCKLPPAITFAIIPRLKHSKETMYKAAKSHHETIIHIPMEPKSYPKNDPGEDALYITQQPKEMQRRIENFIKELPYCIGANNHMGSLITANSDAMKIILKTLEKHNLFFIDSKTTSSSVAKDVANDLMMPCKENSLFLDNTGLENSKIDKKIKILKKIKKNKIVVITHCTGRKKLEFLQKFIKKAKRNGFELIPVSELFKKNISEII